MYRRPLIASLAAALAGCVGFTGAGEDDGGRGDDDATELWVIVFDEETGERASGVGVTVLDAVDYREEKRTGDDGEAYFDLDPGEYGVSVEAPVQSVDRSVELEEGDGVELEVEVPVPE